MKRELKFKPVNLYGSKWLQCIEDSSDPPKVESPVMSNNKPIEDFAKRSIYEEMARSSPMFNQNLETPGCLTNFLSPSTSKAKTENGNQLNLNALLALHHVRPPVNVRQDPTQL